MDCQGTRQNCSKCGYHFDWHDPEIRKLENCPRCGHDRKCGRPAVEGYKFCSQHGGPNPSRGFYGKGAGLTTGVGSSFPITRLAAKKEEMERSGALLTNRRSIDVVRERLAELLKRVDGRDMGEKLAALYNLWEKYKEYESSGDIKLLETRHALDEEFEKVYHDYRSWDQIMDVIDLDRKLVESEVKIAKDLHAILTAEDAYDMIAQFFGVIMRHVNDPMVLKAIQYDVTRLIGDRSSAAIEASDREDQSRE